MDIGESSVDILGIPVYYKVLLSNIFAHVEQWFRSGTPCLFWIHIQLFREFRIQDPDPHPTPQSTPNEGPVMAATSVSNIVDPFLFSSGSGFNINY